jgi:hypothetical protein
MIVYRGTPIQSRLIEKGRDVSSMLERAALYSRYPKNGGGTEIGYIYELEVEESDVDWDAREDCPQGKLKKNIKAKRMVVCDIRLDLKNRQPPIRIKSDGTVIWANGKNIEWVSIKG